MSLQPTQALYEPRPPVTETFRVPKGLGWRLLVLAGSFGRSQSNGEGILRVLVTLEDKDPSNYNPPIPAQERQFRWNDQKTDKDIRALLTRIQPPYIESLRDGTHPARGDYLTACVTSLGVGEEVVLDNHCSRCTSPLCIMRGS